jgi:hypothetical protein
MQTTLQNNYGKPSRDDLATTTTGCDLTRCKTPIDRSFLRVFYRFLAFLDEVRFRTSVIFVQRNSKSRGREGREQSRKLFSQVAGLAGGTDAKPPTQKGVTRDMTA